MKYKKRSEMKKAFKEILEIADFNRIEDDVSNLQQGMEVIKKICEKILGDE